MPPGVLFAVYDSVTGVPRLHPRPEASEVPALLDELFSYVEDSDDHPLVKAGVIHYQIATIHPFEDGNGATARLMSGYYLDLCGYGFGGMGSLEEYFAYDVDEYYSSLQMGLPALYYSGARGRLIRKSGWSTFSAWCSFTPRRPASWSTRRPQAS